MKVRIKDNSVRFRLTKTEVKTLGITGVLHSQTMFNTTVFNYSIVASKAHTNLYADFTNNTITLYMPLANAAQWYHIALITYENTITLNNGEKLRLLVEKDFVCLDHSIEDQSDNYTNPNKTC